MTELQLGDVGEVTETSSRLLYAAGTPEAERWHAEAHGLEPLDPDDIKNDEVPEPAPAEPSVAEPDPVDAEPPHEPKEA